MIAALSFGTLSAREQKLLGVLLIGLAVTVLVGVPAYVYSGVAAVRAENEKIRGLLAQMDRAESSLLERKQARDALLARYQRPAPPLAPLIEKAAQENGIEVPESKDRPDVPRGKKYTERITVVTLRKIGMGPLVKTLEKLELSGYPISVTRLNIKKRTGAPDSWDVELGVSAFDRKEEKKEGDSDASPTATAGERAPAPSSTGEAL
jgi:general secretion pathway protein M